MSSHQQSHRKVTVSTLKQMKTAGTPIVSLTAYDAAYLRLAELLAAPLATFDLQLAAAARKHLSQPPPAPAGDAA